MKGVGLEIKPSEASIIKSQVSSYLHGVHFRRKREIDRFAQALIDLAGRLRNGNPTPLAMQRLGQESWSCDETKKGILNKVEGLCEMYVEPSLWIEKEKTGAFQKLIVDRIIETANRFLKFSKKEKKCLISDQMLAKRKAQGQLECLHKAKLLRGMQPISTISEAQQHVEDALRGFVDDLNLKHLRNVDVSLIEDYPVLRALMERIPTFYKDFPEFVQSQKSTLIWAIKFGQCNLQHLPIALQSDERLMRAKRQWDQQVLSLVRDYFGSKCTSSDQEDIAKCLDFEHLLRERKICEAILSLLISHAEMSQITQAARHYLNIAGEGELPDTFAEVLHARALLGNIFKRPEVQLSAYNLVLEESDFEDLEFAEQVHALLEFARSSK